MILLQKFSQMVLLGHGAQLAKRAHLDEAYILPRISGEARNLGLRQTGSPNLQTVVLAPAHSA
jgi:hypothetical protein